MSQRLLPDLLKPSALSSKFLIGLMMQGYSPFTFNNCMKRLSFLITVDVSFAIDIRNHFAVQDSLIAHMKMCRCGYPWQFSRAQIAALKLVLKSSNMRQIQKSTFSVKLTRIPFVFLPLHSCSRCFTLKRHGAFCGKATDT